MIILFNLIKLLMIHVIDFAFIMPVFISLMMKFVVGMINNQIWVFLLFICSFLSINLPMIIHFYNWLIIVWIFLREITVCLCMFIFINLIIFWKEFIFVYFIIIESDWLIVIMNQIILIIIIAVDFIHLFCSIVK